MKITFVFPSLLFLFSSAAGGLKSSAAAQRTIIRDCKSTSSQQWVGKQSYLSTTECGVDFQNFRTEEAGHAAGKKSHLDWELLLSGHPCGGKCSS